MKDIKIEELIIDYLDGNIEPEKMNETLEKLSQSGYDLNKLSELKEIYTRIDRIPTPKPEKTLDEKFYNFLKIARAQNYKPKEKVKSFASKLQNLFTREIFPKIAFNVLFLIIGLLIGRWVLPGVKSEAQVTKMSLEIKEMKEVMMLTLLNQQSPTERLKAVSYVNSLSEVDNKVINALLETLNNDPNVNVRLVTIEALSRFSKIPEVREGLIESIALQESPVVQIALAELMVSLQEKNSVNQLKKLLTKKDLNYTVKTRIEQCLQQL
jgi:hypothetical protein